MYCVVCFWVSWCQPINSSFVCSVDHRRVWSTGRNQRYVTLSGCRRRHTLISLSVNYPISVGVRRSGPSCFEYSRELRNWRQLKTANYGYVRLHVQSILELGCVLGCTPALSVTTAPLRRYMRQLWRYMNESYILPFIVTFITDKGSGRLGKRVTDSLKFGGLVRNCIRRL